MDALRAYLAVRGMGPSSHVFLYRNAPLCKDLLRSRLQAAGARVGVKVSPHALRHTFATQLLNAGCQVTSIQKLLGHRRLNSTMVYARVHDRTVADDYFAAMDRIESHLDLLPEAELTDATSEVDPDFSLVSLLDQLSEPHLDQEQRIAAVARLRRELNYRQ